MDREGVLLQADGSRHRWFGPDEPFATLSEAVDEATGTAPASPFGEHEDAAGYLAMLRAIGADKGLPLALEGPGRRRAKPSLSNWAETHVAARDPSTARRD